MSFAKFSSDFLMETFTLVDNLFISEHLPYCDDKQIKVYLYGLYLCGGNGESLDQLCAKLDMTEAEVISAYGFFEDMGLVQILSKSPLEVKYLSLKKAMQPPKKYKGEKWNDFNTHLQQLFPERMLTPNEFNEYYTFLDDSKLDQDAMLMIVQYCINLKGVGVRYPYILAVARNWAADGVRTVGDVEDRLNQYENQSEQMRQILAALGRKGGAELEEKQMLLKWTRSWGFEQDAILAAAKTLKGNKSFRKLDGKLDEFYRMTIFTSAEMADYQAHRERLNQLAVAVNKNLGVYYESFEHEIEVYISPWTSMGFEDVAIVKLAHYCFVNNVRTLEGMNGIVKKFYTMGLLSENSIDQYLKLQDEQDSKIRKIIEASGLNRGVTTSDRNYYRTWTADWGFDDDLILYAASQAVGKTYPTPYINRLLSEYRKNGITTVEQAMRATLAPIQPPTSEAAMAKKAEENAKRKRENDEREARERRVREALSIDEIAKAHKAFVGATFAVGMSENGNEEAVQKAHDAFVKAIAKYGYNESDFE